MKDRVTVVTSQPNTLIPLPEVSKIFHHNGDEFSHSQEAMDYIELRMAMGEAFSIKTSDSAELGERREDVVGVGRMLARN